MTTSIHKILLGLSFICLTLNSSFAQDSKRTNIWYFGYNAGIDFNTDPPTPLTDGELNIWEGCASICDKDGNLLIYTDGVFIWNRNHQIIPGAIYLGGDNSSTQSGIIVPSPSNDDELYVFSVDNNGGNGGLQYAVVNMNMNGGLGGLVSSHNELLDISSEKIMVVPHCNKVDFWLIGHELRNNRFVSWLITETGISSPMYQDVGTPHDMWASVGYLKCSTDGSKLALGVYTLNFFEIFDFDNENGIISNPIKIEHPTISLPYGVEFSPDGSRLYLAGTQNIPILYQVNLNLPTEHEIKNSLIEISRGQSSYFGAIQLAPDGNIYVAKDNSQYLSVIHQPNELGTACDFREDDFYLDGRNSGIGLPNLIPGFYTEEPTIELIDSLNLCESNGYIKAIVEADGDSIVYEWYHENQLIEGSDSTILYIEESGSYEFRMTVYYKCKEDVYQEYIDISFPEEIEIQNIKIESPMCGENNGSIEILVSGGTPPYEYSIDNGTTFHSTNEFDLLGVGSYRIIVKDYNNCEISDIVILENFEKPSIDSIHITHTSCGVNNGIIEIDASGGTGTLHYSIDGGVNFETDTIFTDLQSSVYNIIIKDSLNCSSTSQVTILPSSNPKINISEIKPKTCNINNAALTLRAIDGISPYRFSLDNLNFQDSSEFNNLNAGAYQGYVIDSAGCIDSIEIKIDSIPMHIIDTVIVNQPTCGNDNGSITINVSGGGSPYRFSIDNGLSYQNNHTFSNLSAATYHIIVTDENDCSSEIVVNLEESHMIEIENIHINHTTCGGKNGVISVDAINGNGSITYSIDGINFGKFNSFTNLDSGQYTIYLRDSLNCGLDSVIMIKPSSSPKLKLISSNPTTCNKDNGSIEVSAEHGIPPYQYSNNQSDFFSSGVFSDLNSGGHTLIVIDSEGCADTADYFINKLDPATIESVDINHTTCGRDDGSIAIEVNGGNVVHYSIDHMNFRKVGNFDTLSSGDYQVIIVDENMCYDSLSISIDSSEAPDFNVVEIVPTSCNQENGAIIIPAEEKLMISLNGSEFYYEDYYQNLPAGPYTVYIKNEENCIVQKEIDIPESEALIINSIETQNVDCGKSNGSAQVNISGGLGSKTFYLNDIEIKSGHIIENLASGHYNLKIIDEVNCTIDTSFYIDHNECEIYIPNSFTPNGDKINDLLKIYAHRDFKGKIDEFVIFDRWGNRVFETNEHNYQLVEWDGFYRGAYVNPGVYVYRLSYTTRNNETKNYTGEVTVIR